MKGYGNLKKNMENYVNLGACCRIITNTSMDLSIEVITLEIRNWHGAR